MNERDFAYWLKGFFELTKTKRLNARQIQMIKEHLDLVFTKITETSYEIKTEPYKITYPQVVMPSTPAFPTIDYGPIITCEENQMVDLTTSASFPSGSFHIIPNIKTIVTC